MASRVENWTQGTLTALSIELDDGNPRIEVARGATQSVIREKLLLHEEVADLARKIVKHGDLFQGERIISVVENGKHVVLEGNRRVAACQMLVDPSLIPTGYKVKFPKAESGLKTKLKKILADVAPNRDAAEPILTRRHTEQGVKPWSPVAKMRRAARWLDDGLSFEDVAAKLGTSTSQVRKLVRPYNLLKFALNLKCWTPSERALKTRNSRPIHTRAFSL